MTTPFRSTNQGQRRREPQQHDGQMDDQRHQQLDEPSLDSSSNGNVERKQERELPDTWIKAHLQTCQHHQSLSATPLQVAELNPEAVGLWELPYIKEVVVLAEDSHTEGVKAAAGAVAQVWKEQNEIQQQEQQSSSWITSTIRAGKYVTQTVLRHWYRMIDEEPVDTVLEEWKQVDDDAFTTPDDIDAPSEKVEFHQNVWNVDLTIECCKQLLQQRQQASDGVAAVSMYMDKRADDAPCLMRWCHEMAQQDCKDVAVGQILENINHHEAHILARVLVDTGHAVFGNDEQTILVVHGSSSHETHVDVEVAKLELSTAQHSAERQIHQWTIQADMAGKRALAAKSKSQKKALMEMKRRQLLLEKIETSRNVVLNLEMAYHALDQAHSQHQVVSSLKTSSTTLQALCQNSTPNDDFSVLDDFHDELGELRTVQETWATEQLQPQLVVDEEELLQELEELSISSSSPSPDDKKKPVVDEKEEPGISSSSPNNNKKKPSEAPEHNEAAAETTKESKSTRPHSTKADYESRVEATTKEAAVKVAAHS